MTYLPKIELTNAVITALQKGQLRIQRGQWVTIGGNLGRWIGISRGGALLIVHSRDGVCEASRFSDCCVLWRPLQ